MAVGDHVRPFRGPDRGADLFGRLRQPRRVEQCRLVDPPGARDVALAGVARVAAAPRELLLGPDIEERQPLPPTAPLDLIAGGQRVEARLELDLDRLELDLTDLLIARPRGDAAEQHGDPRVAGQFGELSRRHRADAVAAVVEHKPLLAGDAVAAQAQADLLRERLDHIGVAHRRRRAEDQRPRPRNVPAGVRVRPTHIADHEVGLA